MKIIKNICLRLNIYFCIDFIRQFIRIVRYIKNGCSGAPPDPLKRKIILSYLSKYDLKCFIETGTYIGDTLAYIVRGKRKSIKAISIEVDKVLFKAAKKRFSSFGNILILHGDSGKILPKLVKELNQPALFWLDAHYSGANTGKGELETPILSELEAILNSDVKGHVILIDDARCFNGYHDYPHLDKLLEMIRCKGKYNIEISCDIIR